MRSVVSTRRLTLPLFGTMMLIPLAQGASDLLENSPFLPPDAVAAVAQQAGPLELRSVIKTDGQFEFSLYDSVRRQSTWVRLKEPGHDFLVKAYDPANGLVTVEQRSRTYTLALKEAKTAPLGGTPSHQTPNSDSVPELEAIYQSDASDELILQKLQLLRHRATLARGSGQSGRSERQATPFPSNPQQQKSP